MLFQFKKFLINQNKTAMKIGTDGVLLGAWCPIDNNPKTILDIGTGTGIIALMLAQRSNAQQIDAIEIEENAFEQATDNFENSPWADRLYCFHAGLDELMDHPEDEYDLIICNPPFYAEDYKTGDKNRDIARFQDSMPFENLIEAADLLLSENGIFAIIIPFSEERNFIKLTNQLQLYETKITRVKGTTKSEVKRSLISFSRNKPSNINIDELIVETERHIYTPEYKVLVKDFYLKM